jgi:hypothetical protein
LVSRLEYSWEARRPLIASFSLLAKMRQNWYGVSRLGYFA